MSTYIYLNTDQRVYGETFDASFSLELSGFNRLVYNISVVGVSFANTVYPINSTRGNNVLYFQENNDTSTTYSATLTSQDYTGATFAAELQAALNNSTGNSYVYTVTYSSTSKKLTISESSNNPFLITTGPNDCTREIGWDTQDVTFKSSSTELAFPLDVSGTRYVDVISSLSTNNINTTGTYKVLARIPVTEGFGGVVFFNNESDSLIQLSNDDLSSFSLSLRDDRGKWFDLQNNQSVSYTIRAQPVA